MTLTNIATTGDPPAGSDTGLEMAWTCPVCERPGKRTREHVFGRWLDELFGVRTQPVMTFDNLENLPRCGEPLNGWTDNQRVTLRIDTCARSARITVTSSS